MGHPKGVSQKGSWRLALWAEVLRKGRGLEVWGVVYVVGFQVEEFLRKEVITWREDCVCLHSNFPTCDGNIFHPCVVAFALIPTDLDARTRG